MKSPFATVALIALMLASPLSTASEDRAAELKERMQEAQARLNLSDAQIAQMTPIVERTMQAQKEIMARYGVDPENLGASGRPSPARNDVSTSQLLAASCRHTIYP